MRPILHSYRIRQIDRRNGALMPLLSRTVRASRALSIMLLLLLLLLLRSVELPIVVLLLLLLLLSL